MQFPIAHVPHFLRTVLLYTTFGLVGARLWYANEGVKVGTLRWTLLWIGVVVCLLKLMGV